MVGPEINYNLDHLLIFLKNDAMSLLLLSFFFSFFFVPDCLRFEENEKLGWQERGGEEDTKVLLMMMLQSFEIFRLFNSD